MHTFCNALTVNRVTITPYIVIYINISPKVKG